MIPTTPGFYQSDKIVSLDELAVKLDEHRKQGRSIGMATGSFDLLHPGHIAHLKSAKKTCDVFFVCVAPDVYNMQKTQKRGRPIFSEQARAFSVSQLEYVDYVIFAAGSDYKVIAELRPDVYIKGSDYLGKTNPDLEKSKAELHKYGGRLHLTNDEKLSTTDIIRYIKEDVD